MLAKLSNPPWYVVVPVALNFLGWGSYGEHWLALLRWPALFLIVAVGLTIVYRYGPSRQRAKWRWITWGSAIAAGFWIGASMLFSWYVSNFDSYNRMYGSLGAVVGFQIWLWLTSVIVLLGAEFNAETEHQTALDSTVGPKTARPTRRDHGGHDRRISRAVSRNHFMSKVMTDPHSATRRLAASRHSRFCSQRHRCRFKADDAIGGGGICRLRVKRVDFAMSAVCFP